MGLSFADWRDLLDQRLAAAAEPSKAAQMQAYTKSQLPYRGTAMPSTRLATLALAKEHAPAGWEELLGLATYLWRRAEFREDLYAAQMLTGLKPAAARLEFLGLYEEMIVQGAWWDLVDGVAPRLCGLLQTHRTQLEPLMEQWATDENLWKRRSAIICQLSAKEHTDVDLLGYAILANAGDKEFFIRKAIGWALRQYARTDPRWVESFVARHDAALSPLSRREATKHL